MSTVIAPPKRSVDTVSDPNSGGLIASFDSVNNLLDAVKSLRSKGFSRVDVHSPHPIHGLDDALGLKGSPLPWGAIIGASIGFGGGIWMAWWMNAVDYPFLISGKPLFSIIPSLPVAFELAILFAAFAVFGGAIVFGGMPRLANEKFRIPSFARATNDRYILAIDAADAKFDADETRSLLEQLGGVEVDIIPVPKAQEKKLPSSIWMAAAILAVAALIPAAMIAKARTATSTTPRISIISDMDHQPKFKAQTTSSLFADGRSMRPQVSGTIARGDLREDDRYYLGRNTATETTTNEQASLQPSDPQDNKAYELTAAFSTGVSQESETSQNWVTEFPLEVDEALIRRGKQRYEIFCATCHGQGGDGDGLVTLRALELEQGTWVKPTSLHAEPIRTQPVGQLFNSISNGVRKMPAYASQVPVKDRWAIVAYLRALQRTRTASSADVPDDVLPTLRELR